MKPSNFRIFICVCRKVWQKVVDGHFALEFRNYLIKKKIVWAMNQYTKYQINISKHREKKLGKMICQTDWQTNRGREKVRRAISFQNVARPTLHKWQFLKFTYSSQSVIFLFSCINFTCIFPKAPIDTSGGKITGLAYVPPICNDNTNF